MSQASPSRRETRGRGARLLVASRAAVSFAMALAGCSTPAPPAARAPVLIVSIDTLRSDHLPLYGYTAIDTPSIDRLGVDGIVFERAFAHVPITLPSHVSLLSGALPNAHGIRDNLGYRVPANIEWLPEILSEAGYATGAAVSAPVLEAATGMGRGFDFYDDDNDGNGGVLDGVRTAQATVDTALAWLDGVDSEEWFLFVHFYEPHRPYLPAESFQQLTPYDGEIATADAALGSLLDGLEERGLYDRSLVILTADHGEALGEHGERDHGVFVHRESLQVPLIVKLPSGLRGGERVTSLVQLVDVLPTVTGTLLGDESPSRPGSSLLEINDDERLIYAESYLPRLYYGASELRTLIGPRWQYIESPQPELYDLVADPAGNHNLIDNDSRTAARYRQQIEQLTVDLEPPAPVDEETRRKLAALGYLGGAAPSRSDDLPAPSEQIELLAIVNNAYDALAAARWQQAVDGFERAVALNPRAAFVWAQLARAEQALGRNERALDALLKALQLTDYAPFRLISAARLALQVKRYDVAEDLAERALDWAPAESRGVKARLELARGDIDAAGHWALAALDADPQWSPPALQVLSLYLRTERPQEALRFAAEVEARTGGAPRGLNLLTGQALAQLGRVEEAVERVEKEISRYPGRPRAYGVLATFHGSLDRAQEAGSAIDRLLTNVEGPARYVTAVRTLAQLGS